jgi:zinc/manganese transport system ATP-binding protein
MRDMNGLLDVDRIVVSLSGRRVLHEVQFTLRPGEFCGLIGTNGAGKTTLLRTILGLQRANSGSVRIDGRDGRRGLGSIGYVPQKILLDPDIPLRARDLVALGLHGHRLGLPLPSRRRETLVDEMLTAVDAERFADQRVGHLSSGQQQRILIAHALIRRPRLLLLDEPLANLDIRSTAEIVALLNRLRHQHKITVLLAAHDMNSLLSVMDRIVYLAHGRCASGSADEVVQSDVLSKLYGYPIDVIRTRGRVLVLAAEAVDPMPVPVGHDYADVARVG